MKWTPGNRENIEDRRGQSGFGGGGMRGGPMGIGVVVVLLVLTLLTGKNFLSLVDPGAVTGERRTDAPAPDRSKPRRRKRSSSTSWTSSWRTPSRRGASCSGDGINPRHWCCSARPQHGVRLRTVGQRPVLLPRRRQGLPGPELLRRTPAAIRRARRLRAGLRHRARSGTPRPEPAGHRTAACVRRSNSVPTWPTTCRCAWNCRQTAMPASGDIRRLSATISTSTTSTRDSAPPPRSATTGSSVRAAAP